MIVVEGPDGAGKTTLIEEIVRQTSLKVAPRVVSKDAEAMTDLVAWVEDNVNEGWQNLIFDRHRLISEPIYGPIIRGSLEPMFDDPKWLLEMVEKFYDAKPLIIYCIPPFSEVWKNVKDDLGNQVVSSEPVLRAIWGGYYNKAITDNALYDYAWAYDYTNPIPGQVGLMVRHIQQILNERNAHVQPEQL